MIRDIQVTKNLNWLKALAVILLGMTALVLLLQHYGAALSEAISDVAAHVVLLLLGFGILGNTFRFYLPKGSDWWFAVVISIVWGIAAVYGSEYLLKWFLPLDSSYNVFVEFTKPIRLMVFILVFVAWSAILVFYAKVEDQIKIKERQEKISQMAKEAELFHLRQQLQPHFLFNSLNSINALVKSQPDQARQMVLQLAEFLRGTIKKDDRVWLSVEDERSYLGLYLDIEKVRFGHRLIVNLEVGEDALSLKLPPLMVQPLLENAIKHGLYGIVGEVNIGIGFRRSGADLIVTVSNPFDATMASKPTGEGFGLESVRRRLYLMFGRNDLLAVESRDGQFLVTLKIPQYHVQSSHSG